VAWAGTFNPATPRLRVCIDLNVWYAGILADAEGRHGTAAQMVTAMVRERTSLGIAQLVISWGMLDRLQEVLDRKLRPGSRSTTPMISAIAALAMLGPDAEPPHLVLGGTGLVPLRDEEDAHVLDVAVAGRADLVVTANFRDFLSYRTDVREPGRIAIYSTAQSSIIIAHLFTVAEWIRRGEIVIP
jgi:predicted nucleic acid-binding protein